MHPSSRRVIVAAPVWHTPITNNRRPCTRPRLTMINDKRGEYNGAYNGRGVHTWTKRSCDDGAASTRRCETGCMSAHARRPTTKQPTSCATASPNYRYHQHHAASQNQSYPHPHRLQVRAASSHKTAGVTVGLSSSGFSACCVNLLQCRRWSVSLSSLSTAHRRPQQRSPRHSSCQHRGP